MSSARWLAWNGWLMYEPRLATGHAAEAGATTATPSSTGRRAANPRRGTGEPAEARPDGVAMGARRTRKANGLPPLYRTPGARARGDGAIGSHTPPAADGQRDTRAEQRGGTDEPGRAGARIARRGPERRRG